MGKRFKIGLSSCIFHADPQRAIFKGKSLLYLEESMAHYVMKLGGMAFMIPTSCDEEPLAPSVADLVSELDGLLLQGGADVSPRSYGEEPMDDSWHGDYVRDQYEIQLIKECIKQNKPVFGICRGQQILNVALGGSLYQDIQTQVKGSLEHRNWEIYDQNFHNLIIEKNSRLSKACGGITKAKINSVHHQSVKVLGQGLFVESFSEKDKIIESIRLNQNSDLDPYCFAVQWHPEFQDVSDKSILDPTPLLKDFYAAMELRKNYKGIYNENI